MTTQPFAPSHKTLHTREFAPGADVPLHKLREVLPIAANLVTSETPPNPHYVAIFTMLEKAIQEKEAENDIVARARKIAENAK